MRNQRHQSRSLLVVTALSAIVFAMTSAVAAPKGKGKGGKGSGSGSAAAKGSGSGSAGGSGSDSGDIEMDDAGKGVTGGAAGGTTAPAGGSASGDIQMDDEGSGSPSGGDLAADIAASDAQANQVQKATFKKTPLSWRDILVVVRKPFLKVKRTEFYPFVGTTLNDNIITHYSAGGEISHYLTDVLAIGVEGQAYTHSFNETYDLVARQTRRLPTLNQYVWSAALDFHYVPVYGKFAVLDRKLVTWEVLFTAGIGAGESTVIPRDPKFPGFNNFLIQPNVGAGMRFFLARWLTVNLGIRDYAFVDHFEPTNRTMYPTGAEAQNNATSSFINNIMFQIGLGFWLPATFEYTTFR